MILVIDNYDSFTYNLVQFIGELGAQPEVVRNDALDIDGVRRRQPCGVIVSPGPGRPENAGISVELVEKCGGEMPILGVCLGHQAIGYAYGASIVSAPTLVHGKSTQVKHDGSELYLGVPNPFLGGRYHSLVVGRQGLPEELEVTAEGEGGLIMGMKHRSLPTFGVQFHPESILTDAGKALLGNFLRMCGEV